MSRPGPVAIRRETLERARATVATYFPWVPRPSDDQIDAAARRWAREDAARGVRIIPGPRYPVGMVRPCD